MSIPDAVRQSDINLPEDLRWLSWVAGSAWPEGSENGMFALADAWSEASAGLTGLVSNIEDAVDEILSAYPSAGAGSAMARTLQNLTDESDQASLQAIAKSLGQLADSCDQVGCAIQQNKIMIIVGLVQLVYEIALAWLFPPTAGPAQAALIGWYRIVFQYLKQLLRQMLVAALKAMGQQVILTLLIQLGQMAAGHRDGVNGKDLWFAALGGALGGAFGAMFGKLGGDLFKFLGGKITRSQFDSRFQQLMRGAVEGGAGGVGGMVGGGIANQVINGGEFELDPRMLGAGAAGAFSGGAGRWRGAGAGGGKVHVDPVGGPRSPAGSTPPTKVPPSASDTGPAAAPKSASDSPNVNAGKGSGAQPNESLSEYRSGSSASDHGGDQTDSTVSSPHRNTAEDNLSQQASSAKSGGDDSSAPNTGRAPANHEQSESTAQQQSSDMAEPAPQQHDGGQLVPQPHNAANASQQPASNASGGDKSTSSSPSAQRGADTKVVASRDNLTTAPKSDVSGDHSARAQPRAGGALDAPESIQAKQVDSTVAPRPDEVSSSPVQRRAESAQPEIDSVSPNRPDAPQGTRPNPENSAAATDRTTPVKEPAGAPKPQGDKGEKAPARDTSAAPVAEPRARAGAKGIKGVSDDLALVGKIDEATGLRWRLVETSLLDPAWPGGKAFVREVLGFEQTMQMLRGNKSPHEGRDLFRPFQDGDLPMRPGFGQKKAADAADGLGEGAGGGVRGYDERNSRGVFRFNTDELPDHRYTIDKDGLWSKASDSESNGKPDPESDVIPRKGATTIEVPRQGPILQRWAEMSAPAMRTVVGDHDGNWYVGKNLHHEQFHNAGVYVAFQAHFVNGKMVAVHDWAGAYQPSPTRVKAALEKLGIYGDLDHYDQQGRKYTDSDREGWTQAAEPTPTSRKSPATEDDSNERPEPFTRAVSDEPQRDFLREAEDITRMYKREDWENATPEDLREALRGSVHHDARDAESVAKYHRAVTAAVETIRRGTTKFDDDGAEVSPGKVLRWTQVMGTMGMREGPINMDAGEGKTFVFLADSILKAAAGDSVHVFTTRDTLANDAVNLYKQVLGVLGPDVFNVVRMNPNGADESGLDPAKPTIYIGTLDDAAFGQLRGKFMRGDIAVIDELDEALYYADTTWIISDGPSLAADPHIASRIMAARHFLDNRLNSGDLSPADFDRTDGQIGGPAKLNAEGAEKVRRLLAEEDPGASPDELAVQIDRVNSAASAHWEFVENDHYIVHRGGDGVDKVYIIDQTTHKVMFDPATSTESRWNGGLAQAIEAKHGITIRGDSVSSQSLTAKTMLAERYEWLSGASGTAEGVSGHLVDNYGMKPVVTVPRFTESKLDTLEANLAPNQLAKHDAIADKLISRHSAQARPELVITNRNSEVAEISARLKLANIPHEVVDARWFADRGPTAEADLKAIFDKAGQLGEILIINRQGGRGVDIEISDAVNAVGGLHVSISGKSDVRDIDIQAENRAARNGQKGSVEYFLAADDALFAGAPHHAQTIIRYTDAVTSHENATVRLDEARATRDLAESADAAGSTARTRAVRDTAFDDYAVARDAHQAATAEREAAETAVRAAASNLQAENAARRMGRTVAPPIAVAASAAQHTPARDLDIPSPIPEQQADLVQPETDVSQAATGSFWDDLTGAEPPQLFGDDQFGPPVPPLAVVDFPGLFVADTTGHLVAFGTEEMPVVRTYSHEQNLVHEIEHPVSGPVVLDSALVAELFTTRTRDDGTVVVSSTATGAHVVTAGAASMLPAGSVYGRPDPLDSTKFTLYGGSTVGWLSVDANRIGVTARRATGPLQRDDVPEAAFVNGHGPAPAVLFADPRSRVLGRQLAELADEIKASRNDSALRAELTARRTALHDELENHFANLPMEQRTIAVARAMQLGSIDRHTVKLAAEHQISLETARAEMKAELVAALAGKDIAVRISEDSLLEVLQEGRFKTIFDLGDTGTGMDDRALLEARWFGHDRNDHPIDKRAVYGYVRVGGEQPVGDLHDERLNVYGDAVVVLKSAVRARTTVCVGDSIGDQLNVYPSSLEDPAPESFGVYPPRRPGLPSAHVGLRRDLTHSDFRKWGYVEAQVHGGVTSADIDHVVFKWEPETALRDQLRAAGIPWKVLEHTDLPIVNKPGQVDPAISSGWETYLNSSRVSDDPNALRGKNFLGVTVSFTYADVVTQDLIGPAGTPIGVSYKHVESEIEGAERWAGAQQWHDKVVRTRPGQTGNDVFAGQTRVGHEVVAAPWAAEYGGVGREPIFVNAHAGPNTFEIRLRTGTTLEVSGATFAKLVEQSAALEAARAAGGPSSVVLVACEPAKGSAATNFAATLHQRFPAAPVHAAASAVWISNWRNPAAPTVRYRYLAADNNAGWVSLHSDGTRVEHAGTRYPTGATGSSTTAATKLAGSNSLASSRNPIVRQWKEVLDPPVSSPLTTTTAEGVRGTNKQHTEFEVSDVLTRALLDKSGTTIGVSFVLESEGQREAIKWARAASGQDMVVLTDTGQDVDEVTKWRLEFGKNVVDAPWKIDYAQDGPGPVYIDAHANSKGFMVEIIWKRGTKQESTRSVQVDGANYAKIVKAAGHFQEALRTGGQATDRSLVLISCKAGKRTAATDFALAMRDLLPTAPVHAGAGVVMVSAKKAGKTFATLGVNNDRGWVTIGSDGAKVVQQNTIKHASAAMGGTPGRSTGTRTGAVREVAEETVADTTAQSGALVGPTVSSGWRTYLNSWRVSGDPDVLHGKNAFELPVNFTYADVVAHEMFGPTGALTGLCFQHVDLELDVNRRWAAATEWHDKVVRTQPAQTGKQAFHGPIRVGQEVVDAPWVAEFTRTGHRPVFVTAHAGPNTFEIRLRTGTTLEVNGTTFAKIVEWSPGLRGPLSTGQATSIVLLACKPAKGSAATDFARTLHQNFPHAPVHAAATSVWQSTMRYPARPNVNYRLLAADRNAGWVTLHNNGTRTEHASTRYLAPTAASSGVVGSGSTIGGALSAPLRFSSDQETTEVVAAVTPAEAAANDARLWKWLTRNMFDDAFDHAVRGRRLRDGSDLEELSDLEGMSEDAWNPAPGAGLLADTAEVQWSDDELATLFAEPDAGSTATALSPPAATAEHHPPTTETLGALPLHVAPAAEAFVRGDRCVLIDGLGTAHRLDVGSGWRAVKGTFSHPGTGAEYIGLVPLDQQHDASPIRIRKTLLAEAFEENAATFFWETTYFLARAGIGIEGSGDTPVWLPPGAVVAVKHAHHPDGTPDPSRTMLGRPKAASWHTLDSDILGPLVPELRRANNPLWDEISGPRVSDVRQGALDNCFLVANMMALARSPLPLLREMMTDLGDSVAVRFFDKNGDAAWVRVSKDLYVNGDNSTRYAADLGVLWPAVLEKAYAVFVGEFGYAGLDGGSPGTTAATMLPATLPGGLRFQPSRAVTDAYFHHPMRMDIDELRSLAGSDDEFARAVSALRGEWEDRVRDHRAREANPMGADADRAQVLALVAGNGNNVWAAVREFYRLIRPDNPGSTEGFRRFLNHELSPEQRTRWASNIERLVDSVDRAASWRTRELDQQTGRHIAERVDFALGRGDLVMLGTRNWGRDDTVQFPGLAGNHGYTALGVQRDRDGCPVALRLRNPWGTNRSAQPPLPGITFRADGVVDVELRHLNKFATLAVCGPGARGLFGLDRLAPPGADDLVGTHSESPEPAQIADETELLGVELPATDEVDGQAVAHVSHPIDWKKHLGVIGQLVGGKKLSGTVDHTVVRFRAKNLVQEPILDHQGRTVGITFLYGPDELEVLRTWGKAPNGHGMVFRTRPGEAGTAALAGDRNRIGLDRFVPAPWEAEYQQDKPGPFYISVHADSRGFEVRSRGGRSIVVDGTTFAAIVQASPAFAAAMTSGPSRSVVMIACAVANGPAGEQFSAALHQNFPDRRIYGSRGDVDVHAQSGHGVGLLAAGDNAGWMSYLNAVATDHAATRYDAPATDGRAAFVEQTANGTDIGDWVEQLRSTERFFGEEPYFAVTSDHRVIGFFGADVLVNPMLDHQGTTIGVNFHQPGHLEDELLWARTENFHNVVTRMRDGEDDLSVVVQRILQEGSSRTENVRAPWALDYAHGKNGPVYISAHADANVFEISLRSGVTIDVDGRTFASIVRSAHPFGDALASGLAAALGTPKSFVLMACKVAAGDAGSGFAEVFGRAFPGRPVHASTGTINTHVLRVDNEEGPPIRISWLGASHNAGWMSYRNGQQIRHDHTRHPPPHPDSTESS
ncbi:C2 family cysteine protease [Nocardia nepalensis]|uniref:WXG100-like domain-containing protein n=1 Tax=Nocardia nepalensis TaxID=3375448 RepID=UPI003B674DB4